MKKLYLCYWKLFCASCQATLVFVGCFASTTTQTQQLEARGFVTNSVYVPSLVSTDSEKVSSIAEKITIRVWSTSPIGSGTLIKQSGTVYTVLTASHVLKAGTPPYTIQTSDGKRYSAEVVSGAESYQKDIVLLKFRSLQPIYSIASIGTVNELSVGEEVYAAGFPLGYSNQSINQLALREGKILLLLEKPLKDGYRLAYTSSVDLGMSGGPVLNEQGEVVGINGLRDDPIWNVPLRYEDGTEPSPQIQRLIANTSLAIPLNDISCILKY